MISDNPYADAREIPDHKLWYSLQWQGQKVGYVRDNWHRFEDYLQWTQLVEIKGTARGKMFTHLSEEALYFDVDYPYPLIKGSWFVKTDQKQQKVSFTIKHNQLQLEQNNQTRLLDYPNTWNAQQFWAPQRIAASLSIPENNTNTSRVFQVSKWDMDKLQPIESRFNFKNLNENGNVKAISHSGNTGNNFLWVFSDKGQLLSRSLGSSLIMQQSSYAEALQLSTTDIFQNSLLELDKPLGETKKIARLELEVSDYLPPYSATTTKITQQSLGSFLQIGSRKDYKKQYANTFLRQQPYLGQERIDRIAAHLMKEKQSELDKVQAIMNFVDDFITDKDVLKELTISEILNNAEGDCSEHAALFIALSRSAGIPAREANGLLYLGDQQQKYSAHVWVEVAIDGSWISIDPTWKKLNLDPGYIRIYGKGSATKTTLLAISGKKLYVKKLNYL